MGYWGKRAILGMGALAAIASADAAHADVKAGVDAWARGDYAAAVHEWEGPAAVGDPDAMFNLAQAYRLGRGVPVDAVRAEALYAQAAARGHIQAADTYGLMLFQDGRREAALPYIEDAARRGDPRSEYLLGIARFNGDIVSKDWVQAYALLSMANAQGLPQAAAALAQMDQSIPLVQRQQAAGLAVEMQRQADAARGRALAAADLDAGVTGGPRRAAPAGGTAASRAVANVSLSPSIAAAQAAVAQARQATGSESPAEAGASYARGSAATRVARATPPKPSAPGAAVGTPASGPWRVQLGAFSVRGNVDKLWASLSGRSELAGRAKVTVPAGAVTKLQAGGFASREAAEAACRSLKSNGHECLVTR
jgi:TPR repeat protein